jgi:hypothetical protein
MTRFLAAGVGLSALAAPASAGPVVYTGQTRSIEATLEETYLTENPAEPDVRTDTETAAAPDFGDFNATVEARIDNPPRPSLGESNATLRSTLRDTGITNEGTSSGFTNTDDGEYAFAARSDVTFLLDESRDYRFEYVLGLPTFSKLQTTEFTLTGPGGADLLNIDFDFTNQDPSGDIEARGSGTGTLAPGTYTFHFVHALTSDTFSDATAITANLALTPADGGPGPNPIPLPPGAWAALATTGALGALRSARLYLRRRR